MICTLIFSCTNTETETVSNTNTQIVEDKTEETTIVEEQATEQITEVKEVETATAVPPVQTKEASISEKKVVKTKKTRKTNHSPEAYSVSSNIIAVGTVPLNTVFMTADEVAIFNKTSDNNLTDVEYELPSGDEVTALRQMLDDLVDEIEGFANEEDTTTETQVKTGAFDEVISVTKSGEDITDETIFNAENTINKKSLEYIRRPKPLVKYSGYKIELMTVYNKSLDLNDPLFKTFGGLMFKNNTTNSTTYYLGDFKDAIALNDYLQKVVKTRFPKAKGVKFEKGLEVKYK